MSYSIIVDQLSPVSKKYESSLVQRTTDPERALRIFEEQLAVITKTRDVMVSAGRLLSTRRVTLFHNSQILRQELVEGTGSYCHSGISTTSPRPAPVTPLTID